MTVSYENYGNTDDGGEDRMQHNFSNSRIQFGTLNNSTDYLATRNSSSFLGDRTRKLFLVVIFLGLLSFCLFVSVCVLASRPRDVNVEMFTVTRSVCRETYCEKSASEMSQVMNPVSDPCENFYEYACGKWATTYPISNTEQVTSTSTHAATKLTTVLATLLGALRYNIQDEFPHPHDLAVFIYQSCLIDTDNDNLERATMLVEELGGWPLLGKVVPTPADPTAEIVNMNTIARVELDLNIIFDINILPDPLKPKSFALIISKSSIFSALSEYQTHVGGINYQVTPEAYKETVKKIVCFLHKECKTLANLGRDIDLMIQLEIKIQNAKSSGGSYSKESSYSITPEAVKNMKVKLSDLNTLIPLGSTNWINVIQAMLHVPVADDYQIYADVPVMKEIIKILVAEDYRVVHNWFVWTTLQHLLPRFSRITREELLELFPPVIAQSDSERCAQEVNSLMPYATADIYDRYFWSFRGGKKEKVLEIFQELKTKIRDMFGNSAWLDNAAKTQLQDKLDKIIPFIAFPEWIKNSSSLAEYYKVAGNENSTYIDYSRQLLILNWHRKSASINEPFERSEYWITPKVLEVNAWYHPLVNSITIPIGYLDYPSLSDISQPRSVMFGKLAHTIAHEIFHGFDPLGILFDGDGQLNQKGFNEIVIQDYHNRLDCLVNQYKQEGSNGSRTISEDFPDNAAMQVIYKAYLDTDLFHDDYLPKLNLTRSRQFFQSYANNWCFEGTEAIINDKLNTDVHSLAKFRVLVPLRNSVEFARAFNCPLGSKMNPREKCQVF